MTKITNFKKKSFFFFHIENFWNFIKKDKNKNTLKPNEKEKEALKILIENYEGLLKLNNNEKDNTILIKTNFYEKLKSFEPIKKIKSKLGVKVENIINLINQENIKINLKNIQIKFQEIYSKKYSLMTFSHVLKKHLYFYFLNTLKNPKLKKIYLNL